MNPKIKPEHLARAAVVYVRQSTLGQVEHHTESKRRQYSLVDTAAQLGFASVNTIDDDLGRSGSGLVVRPGFQKLVATSVLHQLGRVRREPKHDQRKRPHAKASRSQNRTWWARSVGGLGTLW